MIKLIFIIIVDKKHSILRHLHTKVQLIVQQLNIIDDTLLQKMAEDIGFCEEVISTIITANITEPGTKFKGVPNVIGIYISKFDMFHAGKTIYHVERVIRETGEVVDNGLQEIYVNTKIDDGTDIAELMRIFTETDRYDFEKFPKVSSRKKQFKKSEGGKEEVCDLVENYAKECAEEAVRKATEEATKKATEEATNSAKKLFENGVNYEVVRESISLLSDEQLREIYQKVYNNK